MWTWPGQMGLHHSSRPVTRGMRMLLRRFWNSSQDWIFYRYGGYFHLWHNLYVQNGSTCLHAAALSGHASLILHLLDAGADPNVTNTAGFTALDIALGAARKTLQSVTSRITDPHLIGGMDCLARSLTPDKLSALRSGASFILRPIQIHHRSQSPLASCQVSPVRRLSISKTSRSPSTCPTTPCRMAPSSTRLTGTAISAGQLNKPKVCKEGALVQKVR